MGQVVPMLSREPDALPSEASSDGLDLDRMADAGCRIVVIGAGFSGVLVTLHLLWRCRRKDRIYLVERAPRFGQGAAYATGNPRHLLNVRVENMSAFADEPDHFVRWLAALPEAERQAAGEHGFAGTFVRRQVYGAYVQHLLEELDHPAGRRSQPVPGYRRGHGASPARRRPAARDRGRAALPDGCRRAGARQFSARPGPARPATSAILGIADAVRDLEPGRPVLLIGSGLTMIDVCLALLDQGFKGPIIALSRRGLLPHPHGAAPRWEGLRLDAEDRRSLASLCGAMRREVRRAAAEGFDWRSVVDALRPHTQLLWQELAPADKQRFLRHLRSWWEIHRHRIAPSVAAQIEAARERGTLRIVSGRLEGIEPAGDGLRRDLAAARRR